MDLPKPMGHSRNCTCDTCALLKQGEYGERLEAEKRILADLQRIEVHGEVRLYDSEGFWTVRNGVMSIDW